MINENIHESFFQIKCYKNYKYNKSASASSANFSLFVENNKIK